MGGGLLKRVRKDSHPGMGDQIAHNVDKKMKGL